jgi:hemerythrin-like metal-binding protein
MEVLAWNDECRLGIPLFDEAHEALAEQIGQLLDGPEAEFVPGLAALQECLEQDFREEEQLMAAIAYPSLPAHRAQHARALAMLQGLNPNDRDSCRSAVLQLLGWFHTHLATADMALARMLQMVGEKVAAG